VLIFVKESIETKRHLSEVDNLCQIIKNIVLPLWKQMKSLIFVLLILVLCLQHTSQAVKSLFFNYMSFVFGWDAQDEGQFLLLGGIAKIMVLMVIYPTARTLFRKESILEQTQFDLTIIRVSVMFSMLSFILYAIVSQSGLIYVIAILEALGTLASPTLRSILSLWVNQESQGLFFAGLAMMDHLIAVIMGILFPAIWIITIESFPNSFLLGVATVFMFASLILFFLTASTISQNIRA
jgi:hypothetical protein